MLWQCFYSTFEILYTANTSVENVRLSISNRRTRIHFFLTYTQTQTLMSFVIAHCVHRQKFDGTAGLLLFNQLYNSIQLCWVLLTHVVHMHTDFRFACKKNVSETRYVFIAHANWNEREKLRKTKSKKEKNYKNTIFIFLSISSSQLSIFRESRKKMCFQTA